jgi:flagellin-like hook-associated protein FlgL
MNYVSPERGFENITFEEDVPSSVYRFSYNQVTRGLTVKNLDNSTSQTVILANRSIVQGQPEVVKFSQMGCTVTLNNLFQKGQSGFPTATGFDPELDKGPGYSALFIADSRKIDISTATPATPSTYSFTISNADAASVTTAKIAVAGTAPNPSFDKTGTPVTFTAPADGAALATQLQTSLQAADGGATNITVAYASGAIMVTDALGRAMSGLDLTDGSTSLGTVGTAPASSEAVASSVAGKTFSVSINGASVSYGAMAGDTATEIAAGLADAINASTDVSVRSVTAATTADGLVLTPRSNGVEATILVSTDATTTFALEPSATKMVRATIIAPTTTTNASGSYKITFASGPVPRISKDNGTPVTGALTTVNGVTEATFAAADIASLGFPSDLVIGINGTANPGDSIDFSINDKPDAFYDLQNRYYPTSNSANDLRIQQTKNEAEGINVISAGAAFSRLPPVLKLSTYNGGFYVYGSNEVETPSKLGPPDLASILNTTKATYGSVTEAATRKELGQPVNPPRIYGTLTRDGNVYTAELRDMTISSEGDRNVVATIKFVSQNEANSTQNVDYGSIALNSLSQMVGANNQTVSESKTFNFKLGTASRDTDVLKFQIDGVTTQALGLKGTSVATEAESKAASAAISDAILKLSTVRANIGASQNRLEFASTNLQTSIENTEAARSDLLDLDVASELTTFTSKQILMQAGVAMLAQANKMPENLLRLFPQ